MILAHSFVGIPITYQIIKNKPEVWENRLFVNLLFFIGIVGAVFPDFDLTLSFFIHDLNHRKLISHSIIPYFILFITIYLFSFISKNYQSKIRLINLVFFTSVCSHLFLDSLVGGLVLLSPLTYSIIGFDIYFGNHSNFFLNYFTSWYLLGEIIVISSSVFVMNKIKEIKAIYFSLFFLLVALIMIFIY